jgi:hypothetical protein
VPLFPLVDSLHRRRARFFCAAVPVKLYTGSMLELHRERSGDPHSSTALARKLVELDGRENDDADEVGATIRGCSAR